MNPGAMYTLARGGHQYGPFTLEQLRDQYAQGTVQPTDLIWCPGMTTWSPVGEVVGPGVAPGAPPPLEPEVPRAPAATPATVSRSEDLAFPKPPSLHWALVLLFTVLTCGLFGASGCSSTPCG